MDFDALRAFVKVAELTSFTRAAEHLGLPKGRVSMRVQQLETRLGTRLLHRTTRSVRLTSDGEQFLERCQHLLGEVDEMQSLFRQSPVALRGRLRVDLPVRLARNVVIPALPRFLAAHPQLRVELSSTDRRVDPVLEGFDCVLRVGHLADSSLVARRVGMLAQVNCASPGYLRVRGTPTTLDDLDHHLLVHYSPSPGVVLSGWEHVDARGAAQLRPMAGVITVNHSDAYEAACVAGLGMIQVPRIGVQSSLDAGLLVEVMPGFTAPPLPVSLLIPHRRPVAARIEAFMAWLQDILPPALG